MMLRRTWIKAWKVIKKFEKYSQTICENKMIVVMNEYLFCIRGSIWWNCQCQTCFVLLSTANFIFIHFSSSRFINGTMNSILLKDNRYVQKILTAFVCLSIVQLFIYLNHVQPHYFIDEVFHVPQTLRYCVGNFTQVRFNQFLLRSSDNW